MGRVRYDAPMMMGTDEPCPFHNSLEPALLAGCDFGPAVKSKVSVWSLGSGQSTLRSGDAALLLIHVSGDPIAVATDQGTDPKDLIHNVCASLPAHQQFQVSIAGNARILAVSIDPNMLQESITPIMSRTPGHYELKRPMVAADNALSALGQILAEELQQHHMPNSACCSSLVMAMVEHLVSNDRFTACTDATIPYGDPIVARVSQLIDENISRELPLDWLAEMANTSPYQVSIRFRRALGNSVAEHTKQRRVDIACRLLAETRKTLATIAHECGFSSQSRMNRVFRAAINMTPLEFRNTCRKVGETVH